MNIFYLLPSPSGCAQLLSDKHVVKMRAESIQMLVTAKLLNGEYCFPGNPPPVNAQGAWYQASYRHHPCTRWVMKSRKHWYWLLDHLDALCDEFDRRYGSDQHARKTAKILREQGTTLPDELWSSPPQCTNNDRYTYFLYYYTRKLKAASRYRQPYTPSDFETLYRKLS